MSLRRLPLAVCASLLAFAAAAADEPAPTTSYLLKADRVCDARSEHTHTGWAVLVQDGNRPAGNLSCSSESST